jgi:hypothetical protein
MLAACGAADSDEAAAPLTSATVAGNADEAGTDATASATTTDTTAAPTLPAADDASAPAPTDAVVVPDVLQFSAPLVGGGTFDGAAVAGMPTAFWFWAPT